MPRRASCVLPCHAAVHAGVLEPEGSMKAVAGRVGLSDAGEDLPVAALGEPPQQLRAELASCAGAVIIDVDIDAGLGRPLEGSQALHRLAIRKPMIRPSRSRTSHSWVARSPPVRAAISATVGTSISQLIAVFWTQGR